MKYKFFVLTNTIVELVNNDNKINLKILIDNLNIPDYVYPLNNSLSNVFNTFISDFQDWSYNKYFVWAALDENDNLYYCVKVFEVNIESENNCIIKIVGNLSSSQPLKGFKE